MAAFGVREATRRGFERADRRVVLGDGAPWIWNLTSEHGPDAQREVHNHTRSFKNALRAGA